MNTRENGLNVQVIEGNWHRNNHAFANASGNYANGTGVGDFFRNNADTLLGGSIKIGEAWITANAARDIARAQNNPNNTLLNNGMYSGYVPPAPAPASNTGLYVFITLAVVGIGVGVYMYSKRKA
jgi:hypothetical protein